MKALAKGKFTEIIATVYLVLHRYKIIARQYRRVKKRGIIGEIDIIASKKELIIFVEVKYRSSRDEYILEYILPAKQITRIKNAVDLYQKDKLNHILDYQLRIDLIYIGPSFLEIKHLKNVLAF